MNALEPGNYFSHDRRVSGEFAQDSGECAGKMHKRAAIVSQAIISSLMNRGVINRSLIISDHIVSILTILYRRAQSGLP